jgi:hypothetical protein
MRDNAHRGAIGMVCPRHECSHGWLTGVLKRRMIRVVRTAIRAVLAEGQGRITGIPSTSRAEHPVNRPYRQKLLTTMIGYLNKGFGPEDAVKANPLKEHEAQFGDASDFEYAALRSMMIASVPD